MSQLSAFTSMSAHSFLCKEQHIDWRNLTVTWKRGGLGTRLQFECMLAVHTDQRLHSSLMHDFINTWTTRPCIYIKNTLVKLCCWRGHKFRPFYLKHLSCCMEISVLYNLLPLQCLHDYQLFHKRLISCLLLACWYCLNALSKIMLRVNILSIA